MSFEKEIEKGYVDLSVFEYQDILKRLPQYTKAKVTALVSTWDRAIKWTTLYKKTQLTKPLDPTDEYVPDLREQSDEPTEPGQWQQPNQWWFVIPESVLTSDEEFAEVTDL